jgi:two-component system chemotaxis response regulator CheB
MPLHAISADHPEHVVPVAEMGAVLTRVVVERSESSAGERRRGCYVTSSCNGMARSGEPDGGRVVALVGSAGGLTAIGSVLAGLPSDFPAPVLVLLHVMHDRPSHAAAIFGRRTGLPVKEAEDGDRLEPGHVYIAPPDAHLRVRPGGVVELDEGPAVGFQRPSANVLLASLVDEYDGRCLAVVLSGMGSDGAVGAAAVHAAGGTVFAQDEETALHFAMPAAAIAQGAVDRVLPADEIAGAIVETFAAPA